MCLKLTNNPELGILFVRIFFCFRRLQVPASTNRVKDKDVLPFSPDQQPLVTIMSDERQELMPRLIAFMLHSKVKGNTVV